MTGMNYSEFEQKAWKKLLCKITDRAVILAQAKLDGSYEAMTDVQRVEAALGELDNLINIDKIASKYGLARDVHLDSVNQPNSVDFVVPADGRTADGYNKLITVSLDTDCMVKLYKVQLYDTVYCNRFGAVLVVNDQSKPIPLSSVTPTAVDEFLRLSMSRLESARQESERIQIRNAGDALQEELRPWSYLKDTFLKP